MKLVLSAALAGFLALPTGAFAQETPAPVPAPAPAEPVEQIAPAQGASQAEDAEAAREGSNAQGVPAQSTPTEGTAETEVTQDGVIEGDAPGEAPQATSGTEAAVAGPEGEHDAAAEEHGTPHYPLIKPEEMDWSFAGPFGSWDIGQLQRGLKVYREVCAACHGLSLVSFRNLEDLGYSDAQVRALSAEYQIQDPLPNDQGDMFEREGLPSDRFPSPYANAEQAAASNNGKAPPDLSLMAKARGVERGFPLFVFDIFTQYAENGPDYIHALLTGYTDEVPEQYEVQPGTHYNPYYVGGFALAMAAPLSDGVVTYDDDAPQTVEQYSRDVSAFLMWAAEPHLVERKATGFVVMLFLIVFGGLIYGVKRKVWASTPH